MMMSKTGTRKDRAFTLVEVMAATSVLALGIVFIYEAFFVSMDIFDRCSDDLSVMAWADEKLWQAKDDISCFGYITTQKAGKLRTDKNEFNWILSSARVEGADDLYEVHLVMDWKSGKKTNRLSRAGYATYYEE